MKREHPVSQKGMLKEAIQRYGSKSFKSQTIIKAIKEHKNKQLAARRIRNLVKRSKKNLAENAAIKKALTPNKKK